MLTILADRTPLHLQGRVYGARFAWSHLWWLGAYPLAGWLGARLPETSFALGGALSLALFTLAFVILGPAARRVEASAPFGPEGISSRPDARCR